jgi:hypothetical protein
MRDVPQVWLAMNPTQCAALQLTPVVALCSPPAVLLADAPLKRTTNRLVAYAVDEAGTQGGLLPVLSEVPQLGAVPGRRMCHRSVAWLVQAVQGCAVATTKVFSATQSTPHMLAARLCTGPRSPIQHTPGGLHHCHHHCMLHASTCAWSWDVSAAEPLPATPTPCCPCNPRPAVFTHSAAVDPERCVMYIYGGVQLVQQKKDTVRAPADQEPGLLHAFDFATYTWSTLHTTGDTGDAAIRAFHVYSQLYVCLLTEAVQTLTQHPAQSISQHAPPSYATFCHATFVKAPSLWPMWRQCCHATR